MINKQNLTCKCSLTVIGNWLIVFVFFDASEGSTWRIHRYDWGKFSQMTFLLDFCIYSIYLYHVFIVSLNGNDVHELSAQVPWECHSGNICQHALQIDLSINKDLSSILINLVLLRKCFSKFYPIVYSRKPSNLQRQIRPVSFEDGWNLRINIWWVKKREQKIRLALWLFRLMTIARARETELFFVNSFCKKLLITGKT